MIKGRAYMKKSILIIVTLCLVVFAQEVTCDDAACIQEKLNKEDKKLNIAYKKAIKMIAPYRVFALREVQRAWIVYRDKKCDFFYHKESGSGGLSDALQCKLDETTRRTKELEEIY